MVVDVKRRKDYISGYYVKNKVRILAYQKKYRSNLPNKIKLAKYHKSYYQKHRIDIIGYIKRYVKANPDVQKRYYQKNRLRILARQKSRRLYDSKEGL